MLRSHSFLLMDTVSSHLHITTFTRERLVYNQEHYVEEHLEDHALHVFLQHICIAL